MILIDTSVWIEFFKQHKPYVELISTLLKKKGVMAFEPVFAELLYGGRSGRDKTVILQYWQTLPKITQSANAMLEAAKYANTNNYHNLGIGLMDTLIIRAAMEGKHVIWSLDKKINKHLNSQYVFRPSDFPKGHL